MTVVSTEMGIAGAGSAEIGCHRAFVQSLVDEVNQSLERLAEMSQALESDSEGAMETRIKSLVLHLPAEEVRDMARCVRTIKGILHAAP